MVYLLRRRRLGRTSCRKIVEKSQQGIEVFRNDGILPAAELVFRWGCTSNVPADSVVNKTAAIQFAANKAGFRKVMQREREVPICPVTYFEGETVPLPCVVRPQFHHQGRKVFVCNTPEEFRRAIQICDAGWYASEIINKVAEYRVFIVQGRTVCVAEKFPGDPSQFAWNVFQGGRFENVRWEEWPLRAVRVATEAFALSGLDFGGVDVMVDAAGKCYVLEINAAPSLTSDYRQTCFAKAFDWIVTHGKTPIPLIPERGSYKKFIHPAVCGEAICPQG